MQFKGNGTARTPEDQWVRLKLLSLAPLVVKLSRTVQGIWQTKQLELQQIHSRWERRLMDVTFYEFLAVLEEVRVKVIVKQVAGGEKHFWSVMPAWKVDRAGGRRMLRG